MFIKCPNCTSEVKLMSVPKRGPANDGSDAWVCLKCPQIICIDCYYEHTQKKHGSNKKKKK